MLVESIREVANNLYFIRRKSGMTQAEVAELANLSDRTYADIERGVTNMRLETLLRICKVLKITPNDILTKEDPEPDQLSLDDLYRKLTTACTTKQKKTALSLLAIYLDSL